MILQNLDYKKYNFRVILTVSSIEPIVLLFLISLYLVGNKKGEDPTPPLWLLHWRISQVKMPDRCFILSFNLKLCANDVKLMYFCASICKNAGVKYATLSWC